MILLHFSHPLTRPLPLHTLLPGLEPILTPARYISSSSSRGPSSISELLPLVRSPSITDRAPWGQRRLVLLFQPQRLDLLQQRLGRLDLHLVERIPLFPGLWWLVFVVGIVVRQRQLVQEVRWEALVAVVSCHDPHDKVSGDLLYGRHRGRFALGMGAWHVFSGPSIQTG